MSQNDLSKVYELQWELSNPQYYPDDSAPPVPNIALSTVEQNSMKFNGSQEYVSLTDKSQVPERFSDLQNFAGVPNDLGFDYRTGANQATADHIFYSYLNVDAHIPPYHFDGHRDLIKTYFRDFVPAACGVYNAEIPSGGDHMGYFCYPGWLWSEYAFSEKDELMFSIPETDYTTDFRAINKSQSRPKRYDVIDLVFHIIDFYGGDYLKYDTLTVTGPDIDIIYRFDEESPAASNRTLDLTITLVDKVGENIEEIVILDHFRISRLLLSSSPYIFARVDLTAGTVEVLAETSNGDISTTTSFTPLSYRPLFRINELYFSGTDDIAHSTQFIGYTRESVKPLSEQYENSTLFKKYFYELFDNISFRDEENFDFVAPAYKGNAWSHVNKLSTMFPYRRLV